MDRAHPRTFARSGNGMVGHTNVSPAARANRGRHSPGRRRNTGNASGACGHSIDMRSCHQEPHAACTYVTGRHPTFPKGSRQAGGAGPGHADQVVVPVSCEEGGCQTPLMRTPGGLDDQYRYGLVTLPLSYY